MEYIKLGNTGLDISPLALGCMTYGDPDRGPHPWTLPEDQSRPLIRQAVEAGINFFDTANVYSNGSSEEILGRAMADFTRREETVIATKVHGVMRPGPNGRGLSRKAIFAELDASLTRLATDYVDLYQIHRWDPTTPIEETLEALHDVVKAGKVRYIGASSMAAWQFSKALHLQQLNGWTRFVTMQDHYNLIYREEEREMFPLCADQKIGVLPWSPLARGKLTRDWDEKTWLCPRTTAAIEQAIGKDPVWVVAALLAQQAFTPSETELVGTDRGNGASSHRQNSEDSDAGYQKPDAAMTGEVVAAAAVYWWEGHGSKAHQFLQLAL